MTQPQSSPSRWSALPPPYVPAPIEPSDRSFGLTVGGVLAAAAAFSAWRGHTLRAEILGAIAAGLLLMAAVRLSALRSLAKAWGRIGHALGWFNSRVLLTLMFAAVFVPYGAIARLFGSDPLERRRRATMWSDYPARLRDPRHYERLF